MVKSIVAGNWKMNKTPKNGKLFIAEVLANLDDINNVDIIFCPPFTGICNLNISPPFYLGAQNCYFKDSGAYTGEISLSMLLECNVEYVIIGHSERRHIFNEDGLMINKKVVKVLESGIRPILCVGETIDEMNECRTHHIIKNQLISGLNRIKSLNNIIIAYEPVWAIGTGLTASSEQISEVHIFIRKILSQLFDGEESKNTPILYGGSVNTANANELISIDGVNGFLVGGASLDVVKFSEVIKIVNDQ